MAYTTSPGGASFLSDDDGHHGLEDGRPRDFWWATNRFVDEYAPKIGAGPFMLYCVLLRMADGRGRCFPSKRRLAAAMGLKDEKALDGYLKALVSHGLLSVTPRHNANGRQTSNLYALKEGGSGADPSHALSGGVTHPPHGGSIAAPSLSLNKTHEEESPPTPQGEERGSPKEATEGSRRDRMWGVYFSGKNDRGDPLGLIPGGCVYKIVQLHKDMPHVTCEQWEEALEIGRATCLEVYGSLPTTLTFAETALNKVLARDAARVKEAAKPPPPPPEPKVPLEGWGSLTPEEIVLRKVEILREEGLGPIADRMLRKYGPQGHGVSA